MSGRDHSYTCAACGCERGGMNNLKCACDLRALAAPPCDDRAFDRHPDGSRDACATARSDASGGKAYPTDPRGQEDAGALATMRPPSPCARRNNWTYNGERAVTWCTLDNGHEGPCQTPSPRIIELDDTGPGYTKRRRAL